MLQKNIKSPQRGFTLIEIMAALFIFTIVSIMISSALHNLISFESATETNAHDLANTQMALLLLSRDIEQAIPRQLDTDPTNSKVFIADKKGFTFVHTGHVNPEGTLLRSTLQRSGYRFINGQLIRLTWPQPDSIKNTTPASRILLKNIEQLDFAYLGASGKFSATWPIKGQGHNILPRAVQISLILKGIGVIKQLYRTRVTQNAKDSP